MNHVSMQSKGRENTLHRLLDPKQKKNRQSVLAVNRYSSVENAAIVL